VAQGDRARARGQLGQVLESRAAGLPPRLPSRDRSGPNHPGGRNHPRHPPPAQVGRPTCWPLTAPRLDFTSSLYLGMAHPSTSLRPWARLTAGAPAALTAPAAAPRVAGAFARLQGCQAATLARSTLHAYWDLVPACAAPGTAIYVDSGAYPISR